MAIGLPKIDVIFKGLANTAVERSTRGVACLIVEDDTDAELYNQLNEEELEEKQKAKKAKELSRTLQNCEIAEYKGLSEVEKSDYSDENYKIIEDVFLADINKLFVIKKPTAKTFDDVKKLVNKKINWIAFAKAEKEQQKQLAEFVKLENKTRTKKLKSIVCKLEKAEADDIHIINFGNTSVKKIDGTTLESHKYLGRLLGILTGCRMDQSITFKILDDLESVEEIGDTEEINAAINNGKLCLINDDEGVRIARGINSLQKNDKDHTEDMKYITIVEAMDLIYEDIVNTFKEVYLGKFKNSYDNQVLLISAINSYFRDLQKEEILDPNYNNVSFVDIEKQREIWISNGKIEAENWSDIEVKNNTFKTNIYLQANVKFLNSMEDLLFNVNM